MFLTENISCDSIVSKRQHVEANPTPIYVTISLSTSYISHLHSHDTIKHNEVQKMMKNYHGEFRGDGQGKGRE